MNRMIQTLTVLLLAVAFTGCELVADVIRAGVWLVVVLVIIVVALIVWLITRLLR